MPPGQTSPFALHAEGLTKRFGDALVLDRVDFTVMPGEVHALLGENGAGKSTLMNILTGLYASESGGISLFGEPVEITSPADALVGGIGMVHQHFRLAGPFTGRENVRLAARHVPGLRARAAVDAALDSALQRTGMEVALDVPVQRMPLADRQRIEILKALSLGARLLILDEPTAVLTDEEAERLLALVGRLAASGTSVVLITHKLREVMAAATRVSVMRRGRMVLAAQPVGAVTPESLATAMIGGAAPQPPRAQRSLGQVVVELTGATVAGAPGGPPTVEGVDLSIHAGEIAGIAGVGGNGQQELAEALVGLRPLAEGHLRLHGAHLAGGSVAARRAEGLRYIPADRATYALAPNASVNDNLAAAAIQQRRLGRHGAAGRGSGWAGLSARQVRDFAVERTKAFSIAGVTAGGTRPVRLLSGGNAQKVVLARELDADARFIIAHSPTRGLDVSACAYVHDRLAEAAGRGAAVLLISEDLEEILALSDRIHVMSRGRLVSTPEARPSRRQIGEMMLGHA